MLPELARHSEKLIYFFEIALAGSYHGAARKLGLSAPTLSYSIKELEAVLELKLFVRSNRGVTLTVAGESLLGFCQRFFREMEAVQRQMRLKAKERVVRIKVGTFPSIALYFWPSLMEALGEDDASLSLSITTGRSQSLLESLVKGEIDVALTVGEYQHMGLIHHELYHDSYAFYCPGSWESPRLEMKEVLHHPLLYIPDAQDEDRRTLRQHVYSWGLFFREDFELDSFEVIGEFIKKGYGVGILPVKVAQIHGAAIQPLTIEGVPEGPFGRHSFFLSYRDDLDLPQRLIKSFLGAARAAVKLQGEGG